LIFFLNFPWLKASLLNFEIVFCSCVVLVRATSEGVGETGAMKPVLLPEGASSGESVIATVFGETVAAAGSLAVMKEDGLGNLRVAQACEANIRAQVITSRTK
jgi:hypothetical protein